MLQSFSWDLTTTPPTFTVIADADSPFADQAAACSIPATPDAPSAFSTDWDCAAPSGFTSIDMAAIDMSECVALQNAFKGDWDNNCDKLENEARAAGLIH